MLLAFGGFEGVLSRGDLDRGIVLLSIGFFCDGCVFRGMYFVSEGYFGLLGGVI